MLTKILEIVWLIIALVALLGAIMQWKNVGFEDSLMFFLITAISLSMFALRRYQRKNK